MSVMVSLTFITVDAEALNGQGVSLHQIGFSTCLLGRTSMKDRYIYVPPFTVLRYR